jgi:phage minor structural protein
MIPILYAKNASEFGNNGIGHLKDAISCKVTEERNGAYTLTLQYPIGGAWYESITEGSVIKAKANETSELQLFRVYKSSKPMKGVVTFYAEHISYDLKGLPLALLSMTDTTAEAALNAGFAACLLPHRFTGRSDITTLNKINITKPRSLRNFCGGEAGSVISVWGGEFEFDNFTVWLHRRRGANNGVVIRYGKNLTDAKQERNISACYTHFCPYAIKKTETRNEAGEVIESTEETITLPEGVIELINPENIGHSRAIPLDISDKFADGEELNVENLRTHAEEYIESHKLGVPDVNITLSFMQIWHSPEYAESAGFERVALCDTVTVFFEDLGINAEAKVIKTEYDTLEERFSKIEVGDAKSNLIDTVSGIKESIEDTKKSLTESEKAASLALQSAIENATNRITGNSGGYVVLSPANNPQEILIMNTPDKETATRVWRWNSSGLGYSKDGYSGTYGLAMTMDGAIVADFITAGTLKAINISGCTIEGGSLNINDKFTVDTEGNVHAEGYVVATGGIIGGCEIEDGKLAVPSANITGQLTASQIDASALKVDAANITGTLTIGQLPRTVAKTSDIPTKVSGLTNDAGYQTRTGVVSIIDGRITADYVEALEIKVSAAQITGLLTIGQLPDTVAETSDIPTKVSELTNDSGYQNRTGVVSIIDGRITADYVESLSCEFVDGKIGGWIIRDVFLKSDGAETGVYCGIYSGNYATDKYYTTNKPSLVTPGTYSNGRFYAGAPSSERISQSKFTVLDDGSLYAEAAKITGEINADSGRIGLWYINDGVVRSTSGVYGSYSYTTTGTDLKTVTGYAFTALTSVGIRYYIKASNDFTSETLAIVTNLSTSTGTPGGSSGGSILL